MPAGEIVRRARDRHAVTVLLVLGRVLFLIEIRTILLWVLIGIVLAIALDPAVSWLDPPPLEPHPGLRRRVVSRRRSSWSAPSRRSLVPLVRADQPRSSRDLPQIVDDTFGPGGSLHFIQERVERDRHAQVDHAVVDVPRACAATARPSSASSARRLDSSAGVVTVLTIMVMLLIEGPRGWRAILRMMVDDERAWAERIGENFLRAVGGYVRGNLLISLIAGVGSYVVLRILGVPYPETLAVFVALLDIIPLVGATIAAVIVIIVGFATGGAIDGIVLPSTSSPTSSSRTTSSRTSCTRRRWRCRRSSSSSRRSSARRLGGIVGVLLAIPIASAGWVLARDLLEMRRERRQKAEVRGEATVLPPPPETTDLGKAGDIT